MTDWIRGKACEQDTCTSKSYCKKLGMCSVSFERIRAEHIKDLVVEVKSQLRQRPGDQPLPIKNDHPYAADMVADDVKDICNKSGMGAAITNQVIADIHTRKLLGISRYGVALQPFNGRDFIKDAYEELMDAAKYLRGKQFELDEKGENEIFEGALYKSILRALHRMKKQMLEQEDEANRVSE